jgi:protein transport protein SEC23
MDFHQREARDGIRFSWNFWPCNKIGSARIVVPVGAMYTPMKDIENLALVQYMPVPCKTCNCVLNPYAEVDFRYKTWTCPICLNKNSFPQNYAQHISQTQLPAELMPDYSTIEYILP